MALVVQQSLFEADSRASLIESARWVEVVMLGEFALGVCVIAVAFMGALMLTGRLPLRKGMWIVVGCFVLLSAPVISSGLLSFSAISSDAEPRRFQNMGQGGLRPELPEADYNPYAQASVGED